MAQPYNGAKPIVSLNDSTFPDWAERRVPLTLVLVRSRACAQSLELEPMLRDIASRYAGRVRVAALDMDESPETVKKHKIEGVPSMVLLREGRQVGVLASCRVAVKDLDEFIRTAERPA